MYLTRLQTALRLILLTFFAFLATACVPDTGRGSYLDVPKLQIGKTTPADIDTLFGPPAAKSSIQIGKNNATIRRQFLKSPFNERRSLILEFLGSRLNGYAYLSTLPEDKTYAPADKFPSLEPGITTAQQAVALLGPSSGRVLLPSWFGDLSPLQNVPDLDYALIWIQLGNAPINDTERYLQYNTRRFEGVTVIVTVFDKKGRLYLTTLRQNDFQNGTQNFEVRAVPGAPAFDRPKPNTPTI